DGSHERTHGKAEASREQRHQEAHRENAPVLKQLAAVAFQRFIAHAQPTPSPSCPPEPARRAAGLPRAATRCFPCRAIPTFFNVPQQPQPHLPPKCITFPGSHPPLPYLYTACTPMGTRRTWHTGNDLRPRDRGSLMVCSLF